MKPFSKPVRFFSTLIATAGGSGFAPKAPGTAGSFFGVLTWFFFRPLVTDTQAILIWIAVFILGLWATWVRSNLTGKTDDQTIVIDEVLGQWIALFGVSFALDSPDNFGKNLGIISFQFLTFRIFDALKPWPIRKLDQMGKNLPVGWLQSFGVIFDDLLAGILSLLLLKALSMTPAFAHETDMDLGYQIERPAQRLHVQDPIPLLLKNRYPEFVRTLKRLGIPEEPKPTDVPVKSTTTLYDYELRIAKNWIDPTGALNRYLRQTDGRFQLFKDVFDPITPSEMDLDFEFQNVAPTSNLMFDAPSAPSHKRTSLKGLRIALDPGHMGSDFWDEKTGKFVSNGKQKVSEGDLNLWTALLVRDALVKLGAEVMLTRSTQVPVTSQTLDSFDFNRTVQTFFHNSMDGWMSRFLTLPEEDRYQRVLQAPEYTQIQTQAFRDRMFIALTDHEARAEKIRTFQPDITLVIHYDARENFKLQNRINDVEAYVPGGFLMNEFGSRLSKFQAIHHIQETRRWADSVQAAAFITGALSEKLKLPLLNVPVMNNAIRVQEGVYARNLFLTRTHYQGLMVYLECLHYDHVKEHAALSKTQKHFHFNGQKISYPKRLDAVRDGIVEGIKRYYL